MRSYGVRLEKLALDLLLGVIGWYRLVPARRKFAACRFYPTCSIYTAECLRQYGLGKGIVVSLRRIMRCNPFTPVQYDPPRQKI